MKRLMFREQNSITPRSKIFCYITLKAIATDLLGQGLCILVITLGLSPKLGTEILRWCSYGMTIKKKINYLCGFCHFCTLLQNVESQHKGPSRRYGHILLL